MGIAEALGEGKEKLPFSTQALAGLILAVLHGLEVQSYAEPDGVDVDESYRIFVASLLSGLSALGLAR